MTTIILSGVGGSTNWLPLIFPLIALLVVAKGVDMLFHFVKSRRLHHADNLAHETGAPFDDARENDIDSES
jgi:hypothetical protein